MAELCLKYRKSTEEERLTTFSGIGREKRGFFEVIIVMLTFENEYGFPGIPEQKVKQEKSIQEERST